MFLRSLSYLKNLPVSKDLCLKTTSASWQRHISANPPIHSFESNAEGVQQKRPKTQPVPKITVISSDGNINVMTMEEAQHISKRRDLKLVKIVDLDTKTQRPVYKLMTGAEYYMEDLKQREKRKMEQRSSAGALKGEKILMLNSTISKHDLEISLKKILKWLAKRYEVRSVISGDPSNMEKSEEIYKFLEESLKDQGRLLQKRVKGGDLRFQILPLKENQPNKTL